MDKFSKLPEEERKEVFQEAANRKVVLPIIIEKDFWVCWTLQQISEVQELAGNLTFKGGTSLSKAYGLIERFSEDIDLTISRDAEFLKDCTDPMENGISGKERERRIEAIQESAEKFVSEIALLKLQRQFEHKLGTSNSWKLEIEEKDKQTILFNYPFIFGDGHWDTSSWDENEWEASGYIRSLVRIEFGARGDIEPSENKVIEP